MSGKLQIGIGAAAVFALCLYLGKANELAALLLPILCHELGHFLALLALGLHIRLFRVEPRGFCLEYYGSTGALGHALAAAAGPAAGLLYAWAAAALGRLYSTELLLFSAGTSLLLSIFNLLPALPLDGGRILLALSCAVLGTRRGERITEGTSLAFGAVLLALGIHVMIAGRGIGLLAAAIWLLLYQENGRGLVNRPELL